MSSINRALRERLTSVFVSTAKVVQILDFTKFWSENFKIFLSKNEEMETGD